MAYDGSNRFAAIRAGGLLAMDMQRTALSVWAAQFLERSASTLTKLDFRCSLVQPPLSLCSSM
jgi:hypothetical protein